MGWAEYKVDDTADTIETVQSEVRLLVREVIDQGKRIRAIVHKVEADDPVKQKAEEELAELLVQQLKEDPELLAKVDKGGTFTVKLSGAPAKELDQDDLNRLLTAVVEKIQAEDIND